MMNGRIEVIRYVQTLVCCMVAVHPWVGSAFCTALTTAALWAYV